MADLSTRQGGCRIWIGQRGFLTSSFWSAGCRLNSPVSFQAVQQTDVIKIVHITPTWNLLVFIAWPPKTLSAAGGFIRQIYPPGVWRTCGGLIWFYMIYRLALVSLLN
jgi:hypothetical protein